jgi:manganese/zinc/iron transport system substrate-binding protein
MDQRSRLTLLFPLLVGLVLLTSCEAISTNSGTTDRLRVVATTGMIADLVRKIGGDEIQVEQLIRSGIDPHLYRPVTDDVRSIAGAKIVFYNGLNLEGRMISILASSQLSSKRVAVCEKIVLPKHSKALMQEVSSSVSEDLHDIDPHVWMDVSLWMEVSRVIEEELIQLDSDNAAIYQTNGNDLRDRLRRLDESGMAWIRTIPESKRILVSTHDAFRYFGERYGIRVEGIHGISTASEAGLKRVEELVSLLVERHIPAVFAESSTSDKSVRSLIEGAQRQGVSVTLGGELFTDSTGPESEDTSTYEGMMRHNFRTITHALGGQVD